MGQVAMLGIGFQPLAKVIACRFSENQQIEQRIGAQAREDFKDRDDKNWLKHSLWYLEGSRLDYKPVNLQPLTVESFEPKVRVY